MRITRTLTQNPVVLEHLVDVHAHLLDGQLQRQRVDMHVRAGRALLIRHCALQVGRYAVCTERGQNGHRRFKTRPALTR